MSTLGADELLVAGLLRRAVRQLLDAGVPDAALDAEWLLADLLATDRSGLYLRKEERVDPRVAKQFEQRVVERAKRIPLQHLLGCQEFYGRRFRVSPDVLIPRGDTEALIDSALKLELGSGARVEDWGCGSGCLAVTLKLERPNWSVAAIDLSAAALEVARENAAAHGVLDDLEFIERSFASAAAGGAAELDLVVCNPPYIAEGEWEELQPEVKLHDPKLALVPGPTGLESYRDLLPTAWRRLAAEGHLLLELGFGQHGVVATLAKSVGFVQLDLISDLAGVPRVLHLQKTHSSEKKQ